MSEAPNIIRVIDGKFGIVEGGAIVNLASGKEIPLDEPLFLLRGKDRNSYDTLIHYLNLCQGECTELHVAGIKQAIRRFIDFATEHLERVKRPD